MMITIIITILVISNITMTVNIIIAIMNIIIHHHQNHNIVPTIVTIIIPTLFPATTLLLLIIMGCKETSLYIPPNWLADHRLPFCKRRNSSVKSDLDSA